MQLNSDNIEFVIGSSEQIEQMPKLAPLALFSDDVITFFNSLSSSLLKSAKAYSDVATFAFWCRKAALIKEKEKYDDLSERLGKGIVFHSTPSNVAVNFAFSFASALLAGNANIVRLPAKDFAQVTLICTEVKRLLEGECKKLAPYVAMVKYASNRDVSDCFSGLCDVRMVWGGDTTIANMRKSPLKARASEITFADRTSIAVIDADEYLKAENKDKIIQDFYNDTYFTDQNACTSPQLVVWLGENKKDASRDFWAKLHAKAKSEYEIAPVQAVGKLAAFYKLAANYKVKKRASDDNILNVVKLTSLDENVLEYKYNSGFFFEFDAERLADMLPICDEKTQTLSYYGVSKEVIKDFVINDKPSGIDRFVPIGKSMDFTLIWDGHDLIRELSRKISVV